MSDKTRDPLSRDFDDAIEALGRQRGTETPLPRIGRAVGAALRSIDKKIEAARANVGDTKSERDYLRATLRGRIAELQGAIESAHADGKRLAEEQRAAEAARCDADFRTAMGMSPAPGAPAYMVPEQVKPAPYEPYGRLRDLIDEEFGLQPVTSDGQLLTMLERLLFERRQREEAARAKVPDGRAALERVKLWADIRSTFFQLNPNATSVFAEVTERIDAELAVIKEHPTPVGTELGRVACEAEMKNRGWPFNWDGVMPIARRGYEASASAVERIVAARVRDEERQRAREGLERVRRALHQAWYPGTNGVPSRPHDVFNTIVDAEFVALDAAVKKETANG